MAKIGVVFKATVDPPSIPTANYSFGYEVISPAMIKQQSPPKKDQTLGPGKVLFFFKIVKIHNYFSITLKSFLLAKNLLEARRSRFKMVKNVGVKNSREKSTIPVIICIL